jgi:pseudouridine-5'-phosphate glycosidase
MGASPGTGRNAVVLSSEVARALGSGNAVVALESAVITHGLPYPRNLDVALEMQRSVAATGSIAATIAVIEGEIRIGLTDAEIMALAESKAARKLGVRDLAGATIQQASGGTTVAATMFAARQAGISVFATGGIGGIHKESAYDISADLPTLAKSRMIVVCAGAKAILDLAATLEALESLSVPVLGYGTNEFPAFYSRESGLRTSMRVDSVSTVAQYWARHCALGMESAVLVANPIPGPAAIPASALAEWIEQASAEAKEQKVRGQELSPFLLRRIGEISGGRTIAANAALLTNNARLAGEIAAAVMVHH